MAEATRRGERQAEAEGVTPRQARIGVDVVTGIVVASVGVALAGLTWRLAGDAGGAVPQPVVTAPAGPVTPQTADLQPALALAPFGRQAVAAGPSTSGVELRGVLLTVPRSASSALIAAPGGPVKAYYVGQEVGGGALLDAVAIDHVLLRVADRVERLELPRPSASPGGGGSSPPPGPVPPLIVEPAPPTQPPPVEEAPGGDETPTPAQIEAFIRARERVARGQSPD